MKKDLHSFDDLLFVKSFTISDAKEQWDKLKLGKQPYSIEDLHQGMLVELEHKDVTKGDPTETAKIALAHLREDPKYYEKLERMESGAPCKDGPKD